MVTQYNTQHFDAKNWNKKWSNSSFDTCLLSGFQPLCHHHHRRHHHHNSKGSLSKQADHSQTLTCYKNLSHKAGFLHNYGVYCRVLNIGYSSHLWSSFTLLPTPKFHNARFLRQQQCSDIGMVQMKNCTTIFEQWNVKPVRPFILLWWLTT